MRGYVALLCAVGLAATVSIGCTSAVTSPSNNVPFSRTDLVVGTGTTASVGRALTVNYTGWLYDATQPDNKGLVFDTSIGKTPFLFTLGAGQVIAGWERGLLGMQVGGTRRLVIPPSLAYGGTRSNVIPAYATLIFDIELLSVQ
jgi:FKBP-type peptidyl-prolyl cis-trans isomerase